MELIESSADGVTIVEPRGRVDTIGAKPFGDRVVELIRSGARQIVIDLKHIQYISSAGFRALIRPPPPATIGQYCCPSDAAFVLQVAALSPAKRAMPRPNPPCMRNRSKRTLLSDRARLRASRNRVREN